MTGGTNHTKFASALREPNDLEQKIETLAKLRGLLGYVEDGSSTSLTISQDDATSDFILSIRFNRDVTKRYSAKSLKGVIDKAFRVEGEVSHDPR